MNCSRPTSRPTICPFASHPVPDFDTLSPVPLPWLSLVFLVLFITMVVRTLKGKGEADVAGWQLVKCTSTYFVSFIDTIKKCNYLRRIWSFCRTGGRQIPSYLSKAADNISWCMSLSFSRLCVKCFQFREVFWYEVKTTKWSTCVIIFFTEVLRIILFALSQTNHWKLFFKNT